MTNPHFPTQKERDDAVVRHQRKIQQHDNEFVEVYERLDAIVATQGEHTATLASHGEQLASHGQLLASHGEQLAAHGEQLAALAETQREHTAKLDSIDTRLNGMSDTLNSVLQLLQDGRQRPTE